MFLGATWKPTKLLDKIGSRCDGQGKQDKGSHLGGGHVTKEMLGEIDVWVAQMFGMFCWNAV